MTTYKTYNVKGGTFISENFPMTDVYVLGANPAPPGWFTFISGFYLGIYPSYTGYTFTAPIVPGTYYIYFVYGLFSAENYQIVINVLAENDLLEYENCCGDRNIAWYNIQGGWQNYIFTGVKTFEVKIGDEKTFKTNQLVKKKSQINGVYDGEIVTTGDVPKSHVDLLDSLRYSVQAFLLNDETGNWDIPILTDANSFVKYKSTDKLFDVKIRFIYAEEKLIQTQ